MSGSEETVADVHAGPSIEVDETSELVDIKNKRKILKGRITRAINRVRESLRNNDTNIRRIKRELSEIKQDCETVRTLNNSLYNLVLSSETIKLDKWDDDLLSTIFDVEEEIEDYITSLNRHNQSIRSPSPVVVPRNQDLLEANENDNLLNPTPSHVPVSPSMDESPPSNLSTTSEIHVQPELKGITHSTVSRETSRNATSSSPSNKPFDSWIDELKEYTETDLNKILLFL
ncbi:hypothetical protein LOTGIDRAFT_166037 [Lottia gigantea]|uniref:Uncharacterized protein n=1 Tax=Lottia gigantea TaxID=225164 RepID=V3ZZC8_LOTGI|nr:hypothetical protein LOTGIDRAFT_166037 [Lottia gigantea]ESO88015.1 hypothetical protein LOTGIDRAFT_166037 [Lottia gigantea]